MHRLDMRKRQRKNGDFMKICAIKIKYQENNRLICMYNDSIDIFYENENKEFVKYDEKNNETGIYFYGSGWNDFRSERGNHKGGGTCTFVLWNPG